MVIEVRGHGSTLHTDRRMSEDYIVTRVRANFICPVSDAKNDLMPNGRPQSPIPQMAYLGILKRALP